MAGKIHRQLQNKSAFEHVGSPLCLLMLSRCRVMRTRSRAPWVLPRLSPAVPPGATPAAVVGHDDLARLDRVDLVRRGDLCLKLGHLAELDLVWAYESLPSSLCATCSGRRPAR